jgi:hypothetical protein
MPGGPARFLEEYVATTNASDGGFRRWRRSRPFWGGLLLLIAGLELFLSANLTLGDLEVHMGPEGFLSYLLPLLLILCGVLSWVSPGQRLFYGILGLLTAVYSLVGLNLGGFGLGMLLGIVGGALVLAWAPTRTRPAAPTPASAEEEPTDDDSSDEEPAPEHQYAHDPAATMIVPGFTGGPDDRSSQDTPLRPAHQPEHAQQFPGAPAYPGAEHPPEAEPPRPPAGGGHGKTFVIALVAAAVTAAVLAAGSRTPARAAEDCPEGLPSRPAAAAKKEAARQSSAGPSPSRSAAKTEPKTGVKPSAPAPASPSVSAEPDEARDKAGNPIVNGWNGIVDGVGDLLGIGDGDGAEAAPEPSTPTGAPAPTSTPTPSDEATSPTPSGRPEASGSPTPSASSGSASPTPSGSDIPCLGPRVFKAAGPDDTPLVSGTGSTLRTKSLTMYNSRYDGVIQLDTAKGKISVLKFSMRKAVNERFSLTVPEAGGNTTLIESRKLTIDGDVRFYTPRFKGKLFGIIPVTFTPQSPPPLTLPVLWFTDVEINLTFVRCDTLTGARLAITG